MIPNICIPYTGNGKYFMLVIAEFGCVGDVFFTQSVNSFLPKTNFEKKTYQALLKAIYLPRETHFSTT